MDGITKADVIRVAIASEHRMGVRTGGMDVSPDIIDIMEPRLCIAKALLHIAISFSSRKNQLITPSILLSRPSSRPLTSPTIHRHRNNQFPDSTRTSILSTRTIQSPCRRNAMRHTITRTRLGTRFQTSFSWEKRIGRQSGAQRGIGDVG